MDLCSIVESTWNGTWRIQYIFLSVPHLLNDPRTQQNPPPEHTFQPTSNYNHPQEDPCQHSFAVATDYYPPQ